MVHTYFCDAVELVDWLEIESSSSEATKDEIQVLKVEVRFVSTFLRYTADRCCEDEILAGVLRRIRDLERDIDKLQSLASSGGKQCAEDVDDAVCDVLDKIKRVKPQIREVQKEVSRSLGSDWRESDDEFLQDFIDSLREDLEEVLGCEADLLEPSLKQGIEVLKRKLGFLKGLLSFTARRCQDYDALDQLLAHVQAVADNAAYLAYSCLIDGMDEHTATRLALELSDLVQSIDPVKQQVREIYTRALKASKPKLNTHDTDETAVDFVDSLLENTSVLLNRDIMPVKDQIEVLHVELRSLRYFLKDMEKFTEAGKSIDLRAHVEVIVLDSGPVIFSLFAAEVMQEIGKETRLALSKLLDHFKLGKVLIRKMYVDFRKEHISSFPMTDELGAVDLLLQSLKELLNDGVHSIALLKDHIQIVRRDLELLESFLTTIARRRHDHEKLNDLWSRIINVVYKVEYVIDLVVVQDGSVLHHMLWLSDLIEEIKLIKCEISLIPISNDNLYGRQQHNITKISSASAFSQMNIPRIDGSMVGFKDEEEKVVEQLVWGSMQLKIVCIVGMPGLGKTFLARKVYHNPIIKVHFHVLAWCSVSQVYYKRELLIDILGQIKASIDEISRMTDEELAAVLYKSLKGAKYLIVLDDIWDIKAWNDLRRCFPNDNVGSRIILMSRFSNIALQARHDSVVHHLRHFTDSESWELLQNKVFRSEHCPSELLEVGQQIAKRCNGLPLAVAMVAGLLAMMVKELKHWREVAKHLSSYIIFDPPRQCMGILELSYTSLPDYLKPCFLYFRAFAGEKEILVTKLTRLWIAEGFIRGNEPNLECIAENYLMDLIDRNLIIVSKRRSTGGVKTCLVHDLVCDFCVAKAKAENFLMLIEGCGDVLTSSTPSNSIISSSSYSTSFEQRRLSVHYRRDQKFWSKSSGPFVRSLLFFAPGRIRMRRNEVSSIICGFRLLRELDLMCVDLGATFPEGIESLAQLRFLAVSGSFSSLPPSINNLRHLETFLVRAVRLISLPYGFLDMHKLRHLHMDGGMSLVQLSSDNPSQLDGLQTLSTPLLSCGDDMKIMRRFPNLKKLSCKFQDSLHSSSNCDRFPMLDFLGKLESLKVSCGGVTKQPFHFSSPSSIKKLTMSTFRLPWEQISIFRNLPNLEVLKLLFEAFEGHDWNMQYGEFPRLKF